MLVLLPPSEGKTAPLAGASLDVADLSSPGLGPMREKVLDALIDVSARPDAVTILGVGASIAAEVARNSGLRSAPTARADRVYSGVLFAAAGLSGLTPVARARAEESVRIFSGLWGVTTPGDRIPAYRLSMATDLPGIGPLAAAWRDELAAVLDTRSDGDLVVDCRSATYLSAWRPPRGATWVQVRVVRELAGVRSVVSHNAKHARGVLTRHLLARRRSSPVDADGLAAAASELIGEKWVAVELGPVGRGARVLTLVVH
ncbi:peroxide stress protein YaaA [Cellulomonas sp. WB94]|uniref:YaaA family protein n=1 Tax=Cellulomonas sp. WB94 TaxID=2173174 RepID=UPI000D56A56C|nr:peroxide stress protein YaaA [Cellulomonas sp. WB94]PVU83842.1 peroxide stress protein YaaA [Cellulomonas sp. WB94]